MKGSSFLMAFSMSTGGMFSPPDVMISSWRGKRKWKEGREGEGRKRTERGRQREGRREGIGRRGGEETGRKRGDREGKEKGGGGVRRWYRERRKEKMRKEEYVISLSREKRYYYHMLTVAVVARLSHLWSSPWCKRIHPTVTLNIHTMSALLPLMVDVNYSLNSWN